MKPGDTIRGRYGLQRLLGERSGTQTWLVLDQERGHPAVLKSLAVGGAESWKAVDLFEREGRVLRSLEHPRIPRWVDTFSMDEAGNVTLNLVQEFVDARNLRDQLRDGRRFDERGVLKIIAEVASILEYLHGLLPPVIHRDIKPSNLLHDGTGIYLIDFGAVKDGLRRDEGSTIVGTYGYMAVEQFEGRATPASDLYGTGATVLFLMSGREPNEFERRNLELDFRSQIKMSDGLADLLRRMVEPSVEKRIQTAKEVRTEAEALLRGRIPAGRTKTRVRRRSTMVMAASATVGAIGTVGLFGWARRRYREAQIVDLIDRIASTDPTKGGRAWLELGARFDNTRDYLNAVRKHMGDKRPVAFPIKEERFPRQGAPPMRFFTAELTSNRNMRGGSTPRTVGESLRYHLWQYEGVGLTGSAESFDAWWSTYAPHQDLESPNRLAGEETRVMRMSVQNLSGENLGDVAIDYGQGIRRYPQLAAGTTYTSDVELRVSNGLKVTFTRLSGETIVSALPSFESAGGGSRLGIVFVDRNGTVAVLRR